MGSSASKSESSSPSGGTSNAFGGGNSGKIQTRTIKKKQLNAASSSLSDSSWASPYRFRELYDPMTDDMRLAQISTAASPSAHIAAKNAVNSHLNELFFGIATNTQWQQQQVRGLFAVYKKCCLLSADKVFDYRVFCQYFFPPTNNDCFPPRVLAKLFRTIFDTDEDGLLSFPEFVTGVSTLVHGQRRQKMQIVFDLFDVDNDGAWSYNEALSFLRCGMLYIKHLTIDSLEQIDMRDMLQSEQYEWWQNELKSMHKKMEQDSSNIDPLASNSIAPIPRPSSSPGASSKLISFAAFRHWSSRLFRFRAFLSRFDVLPSPVQESDIIRDLWSRNDTLRLGGTWYAMSESWWRSWKAYSGFKEPGEEETSNDGAAIASSSASANGAVVQLRKQYSSRAPTSPPYLISDTDTDSDRETDTDANGGGGAAANGGSNPPITPAASRTVSHQAMTPAAIQIQGLGSERNSRLTSHTTATLGNGVRVHYPVESTTQGAGANLSSSSNNSNTSNASNGSSSTAVDSRRNSVSTATPHAVSIQMTPKHNPGQLLPPTEASPTISVMTPSPNACSSRALASALAALRPAAIDNTDISSSANLLLLKNPLMEHEDFLLLNEGCWRQLVEWYGLVSASTEFPRSVIEVGKEGARIKRVELYPLCVRVQRVGKEAPKPLPHPQVPAEGTCLLFPSPSHTTVATLEQRIQDLFFAPSPASPPSETKDKKSGGSKEKELKRKSSKASASDSNNPSRSLRIWIREGNDHRCLTLEDMTKSLEELEFQSDDILLVELERVEKRKGGVPQWYMDKRKIPRPWTQFQAGDKLDARDKQSIWYASTVREVHGEERDAQGMLQPNASTLKIHFEGWEDKWDEFIPVASICRCRGPCSCTGRLASSGYQIRFKAAKPYSTSATDLTQGTDSPDAGHPSGSANAQKGLCGLVNLTNTCFMNSTLQCLSNTPFFVTNYILNNKYVNEINKSNPLGHKGQLATEFANLIREMWSGEYRAVAPSKFKRVISDFAPQFDGYQQHDSHELLAFLLDGLHEDLNRVLKKVPTPAVESNGRSDAVVVKESWQVYKMRNQSIVVDLFMGMLKSTVVCPDANCGRVSITFDPFRYLTVPLPLFTERQFIITFCSMKNSPLVNYGVILPDHATVSQLKSKLAELIGIALPKLMICDVHKCKLLRVLMDSKRVSTIRENDVLVAYEILPDAFKEVPPATPVIAQSPVSSNSTPISSASAVQATYALRENMVYLQAIHKYIQTDTRGHASMSPRFGIPVCLTTTANTTNQRLHQLVAQAIARWTPSVPQGSELPYTVRVLDHTCSRCGLCPESANCGGCCLSEDNRACGLDGAFALCILWENDIIARQVKASMDDSHIVDHPSLQQKVRTDSSLTLHDCMELFISKETLSKEDAWFCSKCKDFRQATKQLHLFHAPEILIIHLKRFLQINRIRREKQTTMVDFPVKGFDLTPYMPAHALDKGLEAYPIYDLFAISNHSGSLSSGHYTSFCKNPENHRWYLFDDSRVVEVNVNQIKTPYAYMLMYKRRA